MKRYIYSRAATRRACQGFSLFEVLITVVVVGIGLLGLAGLQFAGLRASNNANEHTIATHLAQDVVERIRANRLGRTNGRYTGMSVNSSLTAPSNLCDTPGTACDDTAIANVDRYRLSQLLYPVTGPSILPGASIEIAATKVTIKWGNTGSQKTLVLDF